ncbi:hypothetical protein DENSPDRAFT_842503 [Dentipellis sp. KUC8613]|nr:hypothetical protein DENSPDRAFT_842503 [Dentipellis sp. KUC8613]
MLQPLIFYDIPGTASKTKAWTPNPWKARFALNIKGLPYKTVWVEYPEIADLCKKIGVGPTSRRFDKPLYTLPALQDPNTGAAIADSFEIAAYLDATYPDTTPLFPGGTKAFQAMFLQTFEQNVMVPMVQLVAAPTVKQLLPRSQVYWRGSIERGFGKPIEEMAPAGPVRDALWKSVVYYMDTTSKWASGNSGGVFMMGDKVSFADIVIVVELQWLKIMEGAESKEWKEIMQANDGRWARLWEAFAQWEWVDEKDSESA